MFKKYFVIPTASILLVFAIFPACVLAAQAKIPAANKGLTISPVRQFLSVDAGKTKRSMLAVSNNTTSRLDVTISAKQFTVTPYTYNSIFQNPLNNWVHVGKTNLTLNQGQSANIPYVLSPPANSPPGGNYYTLVASATLSTNGTNSTIQAAELVFITINGKLTTVSHLEDSHIQRFIFGHTIPFTLQPVNTGNNYSFIYVSGLLHGWLVKPPETSTAHLLLPGKVRSLSGSISSPFLPGIYRTTYGYKTTSGWAIQKSAWIVFIPPWSIALAIALLLIAAKYLPHRRKPEKPTENTKAD